MIFHQTRWKYFYKYSAVTPLSCRPSYNNSGDLEMIFFRNIENPFDNERSFSKSRSTAEATPLALRWQLRGGASGYLRRKRWKIRRRNSRTGRINQLHRLAAREVTTPAGHPVNKMQRRRNKVKDKPPPDPHREYLDAESSDEAERRSKIYEKNIKRALVSTFSPPIFRSFLRFFAPPVPFSTLSGPSFSTSVSYDLVARQPPPIPPLNPKTLQNRSHPREQY